MSTTQLTTQEPAKGSLTAAELAAQPGSLKALLASPAGQAQFAAALPKHMTSERFCRVAITAMTRTPKLMECTRESFFRCLLDLSAMGLEPDGRRAHLIPFGNECTLVIDYKGVTELVMRSGLVSSIHADKVCDADQFEVKRGKVVKHDINYREPRGEPYAYYVLVTFKDGAEKSEVMSLHEVKEIMERSQGYKSAVKYKKSHPWMTDFDEMAKKTVFKRASKWLSLSPEIRNALEHDDDDRLAANTIRQTAQAPSFVRPHADPAPHALEVESTTLAPSGQEGNVENSPGYDPEIGF